MSLLKLLQKEDILVTDCNTSTKYIEYLEREFKEEKVLFKNNAHYLRLREELYINLIAKESNKLKELLMELSEVRKDISEYLSKYIFTKESEV